MAVEPRDEHLASNQVIGGSSPSGRANFTKKFSRASRAKPSAGRRFGPPTHKIFVHRFQPELTEDQWHPRSKV
jgi:hypothetical protein